MGLVGRDFGRFLGCSPDHLFISVRGDGPGFGQQAFGAQHYEYDSGLQQWTQSSALPQLVPGIAATMTMPQIDFEVFNIAIQATLLCVLGKATGTPVQTEAALFCYDLNAGSWSISTPQGLVPSGETRNSAAALGFGLDMAIVDGNTITATSATPGDGRLYIFERAGVGQPWVETVRFDNPLAANTGNFGASLATTSSEVFVSSQLNPVGLDHFGAIHRFERRPGGTWSHSGTWSSRVSSSGSNYAYRLAAFGSTLAAASIDGTYGALSNSAASIEFLQAGTSNPALLDHWSP